MYPHHPGQGQLPPPQWTPASQPPPTNGYPSTNGYSSPSTNGTQQTNGYPPPPPSGQSSYPPPPSTSAYPPPSSQAPAAYPPPPSHMATSLPPMPPMPQEPPAYRYAAPPPPHPQYAPSQMHHPMPQYNMPQQPQPAPRQRTAIACRYCRRRKIRCSGFEASEDGRCTNCVRFSQECIFTPVSAQTQAFVPAHTVRNWPANQPPPLYGAYGQPLHPSQHAPPPPQVAQQGYLPSPQSGPYNASGTPYGPPSHAAYDERGRDAAASNKRKFPEPHTPTLPPPTSQSPAHRGSGQGPPEYNYPEPTNLTPAAVSPASSSASYHGAAQPPAPQPYYGAQPAPPRHASPQNNNYYDPNRSSSSPHSAAPPPQGSAPAPSAAPYSSFSSGNSLQPLPARADGRTPPPTTQAGGGNRAGMRINDLVDSSRSTTDNNMLNQLNRRL